jgi:hypothetical protein
MGGDSLILLRLHKADTLRYGAKTAKMKLNSRWMTTFPGV